MKGAESSIFKGRVSLAGQADHPPSQGIFAPGSRMQAVEYALSGRASGIDLQEIHPGVARFPRSVSGTLTLKGKGVEPRYMSVMASCDLSLAGLPGSLHVPGGRAGVRGRADLEYPMLDLSARASTGSSTRAEGSGRIDLVKGLVRGSVDLGPRGWKSSLSGHGVPVRGSVRAVAEVTGPLKRPAIAASMEGHRLRWKDFPVVEALIGATLDESGRVHISRASITGSGSELTARGSVQVFRKGFTLDKAMPLELTATLAAGDIRQLLATAGARGSLMGDASLAGSLFNPAGTFHVSGKGISWKEATLGDITVQGAISQGVVEVQHCDVAFSGSTLTASGRVDLFDVEKRRIRRDPEIGLTAQAAIRDLGSFIPEARGSAAMDAHISGPSRTPGARSMPEGEWHQGMGAGYQRVYPVRGPGEPEAEQFRLPGRRQPGAEDNRHRLACPRQAQALRHGPEVGRPQPHVVPDPQGIRADRGRPPPHHIGPGSREPAARGDAFITSLTVNGEPHKDAFVHMQLTGTKVSMLGESNFGFNGTYDLATRKVDAQAIFKGTGLEPYFRIAGRPELGGTLTGDAVLSGNARDLKDIGQTCTSRRSTSCSGRTGS